MSSAPATVVQATEVFDREAFEEERARRKKERDERCSPEERLRLCDPTYAAQAEARKPKYKYTVRCTFPRPKTMDEIQKSRGVYAQDAYFGESSAFTEITEERHLAAQDDAEAWAIFCDLIGSWPSPKTPKREIIRGEALDPLNVLAAKTQRPLRD